MQFKQCYKCQRITQHDGDECMECNIPKMPEKLKGEYKQNGGYTTTNPRAWTKGEIEFMQGLKEQGYTTKEIAESMDRSETSISVKLKRITKKDDTYNQKHVIDKHETNKMFLDYIQPKTVLDAYAGNGYYKDFETTTNDIDETKETDYHLDSLKFMCKMYLDGRKFDLVDLDPFGSAYDCFDLGIKMATKGIVITFGELGHRRWKRLDFVSRYYNIKTLEDFKIDNMIKEVQTIGLKNKKKLNVLHKVEWQNIGRVYFEVEDIKITEQWEKEKRIMFDTKITKTYNTVKVNAVSGGIYKTYRESWFERFHLKSKRAEYLLNANKNCIVLQLVVCGDMEVMTELIDSDDLDKYLSKEITFITL